MQGNRFIDEDSLIDEKGDISGIAREGCFSDRRYGKGIGRETCIYISRARCKSGCILRSKLKSLKPANYIIEELGGKPGSIGQGTRVKS